MRAIKINFTGQRPKDLYWYTRESYSFVVKMIGDLLLDIHKVLTESFDEEIQIEVITGGAQGVDQCAFWAVNNLITAGHKQFINHLYVPFTNGKAFNRTNRQFPLDKRLVRLDPKVPEDKELIDIISGQELRWKSDNSVFSQSEYLLMIQYATYVTCCEVNFDYDSQVVAKMLNERNEHMVYDSAITIAITKQDFAIPTKGSGTWNCMRDAMDHRNSLILVRLPKNPAQGETGVVYQKYNYDNHNWDTCVRQDISFYDRRETLWY